MRLDRGRLGERLARGGLYGFLLVLASCGTDTGSGSGGMSAAGGNYCSPPCGASAVCVNAGSYAVCSPRCASNSDCRYCCAETDDGVRVCAPDSRYCGASGGTGSTTTGSTTGASCHNLTSCVSMTTYRPSGAGHCDGEITGSITNGCGQAAECRFCVMDGSPSSCGVITLQPGQTQSGESAGLWSCGHSPGANWAFLCSAAEDPSTCHSF